MSKTSLTIINNTEQIKAVSKNPCLSFNCQN